MIDGIMDRSLPIDGIMDRLPPRVNMDPTYGLGRLTSGIDQGVRNVNHMANSQLSFMDDILTRIGPRPPPRDTRGADERGPMGAFLNGALFNFGDEATAGVSAALDRLVSGQPFGESYDRHLAQNRVDQEGWDNDNPFTSLGYNIAGGIIPAVGVAPLRAAGAWASAPASWGRRALRASPLGALYGALYGYGGGEGDSTERGLDAAESAIIGGVAGPVISAGVSGASSGLSRLRENAAFAAARRGLREQARQRFRPELPTQLMLEGPR